MALMCGGGGGGEDIDPELAKINEDAKRILSKALNEEAKVIKMLLLGAGESGKSTIFKQMKIINKDGYSEKERMEFVGIVASNTVQSMTNIMEAFKQLSAPIPGDLEGLQKQFDDLKGPEKLDNGIGPIIKEMWANSAVQAIFARKSEYQLNDSADYYFNKIDVLIAPGYVPSEEDVLRSRVRTTGIVQSDFKIKSINFSMFDVGGQRNERRKWIHAFDSVNCVIFVAALSEYDQKLFEDETMNRMDEALSLFDQIVNSKWFKQTAMILFLNKKDLFETKLKKKPLTDFYEPAKEEVSDGTNFKECSEYFKKAFLKKNKNSGKSIFSHITTAIDTSNVKFVFNAVVAIILEDNLKSSGLA